MVLFLDHFLSSRHQLIRRSAVYKLNVGVWSKFGSLMPYKMSCVIDPIKIF